jgi:hypothetical protein
MSFLSGSEFYPEYSFQYEINGLWVPVRVIETKQCVNNKKKSDREVTRRVVVCTPEIAFGDAMQKYIDTQSKSHRKKWVYDIINGIRESDNVLYKCEDFIILPDTETVNNCSVINWLVVFTDVSLKTIRSLERKHVDMLTKCKEKCIEMVGNEHNYDATQVLIYFHYLPSVYQLHAHVCAPYGQYTTSDICKIHTLENVISNLEIDSDYYKKVVMTTVVVGNGDLLNIYTRGTP